MLKKIVSFFYILVVLTMAVITVVEKYKGTEYVSANMYGSWWFTLLWTILVVTAIVYIIKRKMRHWNTILIHLSFVVILAGAFLTHVSSYKGYIHLRIGETTNTHLPFNLRLDGFKIKYHDGTNAAADYLSNVTVIDGKKKIKDVVSMNNILNYSNVRLYQSAYDEDGQGCTFIVNSDPWGIPVTYVGYAMLFFSLVFMLVDPKGSFRRLLKHPLLQKGALVFLLMFSFGSIKASTTTVLPKDVANHFCEMFVLHNDRVCQMQTYAYDFTKKLSGKRSYKGCTPEQILTGFMFWGDQWAAEKIIKVKGAELCERMHFDSYVSVNDLFTTKGYVLQQLVEEYYQQNNHDALHEQAARLDDKMQLIAELQTGKALNMMSKELYNNLYKCAVSGKNNELLKIVDTTLSMQQKKMAASLPTPTQIKAERIYNKIPFATILFMVNLTLGFLSLIIFIRRWRFNPSFLLISSFLVLSFSIALRWIISGNIPLSNGYESMISVAWFALLITIIGTFAWRNLSVLIATFGFLLSGFFLLVSHINQMDPAIGHIMPVLNSPLLSIHVSVIMMSYALLALTFICGILGICMKSQIEMLQVLSRVFLYPAITTMGLGIFIGAIWANISWGTYWSWDPKETWALITFMIYAVVLHTSSFPVFRKPLTYHLFMIFAFLSIVMTYFGVNYILGGMHSYA